MLGAVILPAANKTKVRRALRRIPPRGRRRLHWHHEDDRERIATLQLIMDQGTGLLAYRWSPAPTRTHETIRGHLLTELAADLAARDVIDLVIESRQEHNDARDRNVLAQAQSKNRAPSNMNYDHQNPSDEPLLWLPDALAGAVLSQTRRDGPYATFVEAVTLKNLA